MKKVIAKRWLNVDGKWYAKGETVEVKSLAGIPTDAVEVIADEPEAEAVQPEKTRKKVVEKAEEPKAEPKAEPRRRTTRK